MISEKDIIDLVCDALAGNKNTLPGRQAAGTAGLGSREPWIKSYSSLKSKRKLITEYDIRAAVKTGAAFVRIPKDAIIGPLALEVIQEKGIKIIRE